MDKSNAGNNSTISGILTRVETVNYFFHYYDYHLLNHSMVYLPKTKERWTLSRQNDFDTAMQPDMNGKMTTNLESHGAFVKNQ